MNEVIVRYEVKIEKVAKDFYRYNLTVKPGMADEQVFSGQAHGIGAAMLIVNDLVYRETENAGMVK